LIVNLYEAMFVVDAGKGGSEFAAVIRHIGDGLTRNGAEIERVEKWDERKLAYPIGKSKRGIYILVYFRSDGSAIDEIRAVFNLSEDVLRVLILRAAEMGAVKGQLYSADGQPAEEAQEPAPVAEDAPAEPEAAPESEAEQPEAAESEEAEPEEPQASEAEETEPEA
jgi:small subunit ribosomal protein S6